MKYIILSSLFFCACSLPVRPLSKDVKVAYQQALSVTEKAEFNLAAKYWEQFLRQFPTTILSPSAMYYKAYSHEMLGEYQSAVNTYRSAIVAWGPENHKDRTQALLRISACYEAMNENIKGLAVLRELETNKGALSPAQREIEIPARKALLFAKEGSSNEAKKYYQVATKNMNLYLRRTTSDTSNWIAEILYRLSDTNPAASLPDFKAAMESLSINQSYLAKTIELENATWSERALQRLQLQYDASLQFVRDFVTAKEVIPKREQQEQQKVMAAKMSDIVEALPQEFLPNSKVYEDKVESLQKDTLRQLQGILLARSKGEGITPEAENRQGIRRGGNVSPVSTPKVSPMVPAPKPTVKDPNL